MKVRASFLSSNQNGVGKSKAKTAGGKASFTGKLRPWGSSGAPLISKNNTVHERKMLGRVETSALEFPLESWEAGFSQSHQRFQCCKGQPHYHDRLPA